MGLCAKPGCARPGSALLLYDYSARLALLEDARRPSPHEYLLCMSCAESLTPPRGWSLDDRRSEPPLFTPLERDETGAALDLEEPGAAVRQLFLGESA